MAWSPGYSRYVLLASVVGSQALRLQDYAPGEGQPPISCAHPSEYREVVGADFAKRQYSSHVQWQAKLKESNKDNNYTWTTRGGCLKKFKDVSFSVANLPSELLMDLMARLREGRPFSWVRIGDQEMMFLGHPQNKKSGYDDWGYRKLRAGDEVIRMIGESFSSLSPADDNLFVAPGTWWLCHEYLFGLFNSFMKSHPTQYTFVDGFYLPLGDDSEQPDWRKEGVEGLLQASRGKPIVLVGPERLRDICFIKFVDFVEVGNVISKSQVMDIKLSISNVSQHYPNQSVVFLVAAGSIAKIIGIDGRRELPKDTFIDVGKMLHGFTCKGPRLRSIPEMCQASGSRMAEGCCSPGDSA
jgi:hypothetical protein